MTGEMNTSETGTNYADSGSVVEIEGRCRILQQEDQRRHHEPQFHGARFKIEGKENKGDSLVKAHTNWDFKNRRTTAPDNKLEGEFIRIP